MKLNITLNNEAKSFEVAPYDILLFVLRREGYYGPKNGCTNGDCAACAVLLDGKPVNSCLIMAAHCEGANIVTIEGIGTPDNLHPLQKAFLDTGGAQCGFCTPGLIISAAALLNENAEPTEADVREAWAGNLCRCTGYMKPIEAVLHAAKMMKEQKAVGIPVELKQPELVTIKRS
jgi:aerobic-type carbon monoxide dehydrogenase small subunit (CoxS/CutS family)